jgi:5-methylcytosine-specific restriction endonuclease McrA
MSRVCRLPGCPSPAVRNGRCLPHQQQANQARAAGRVFAYSTAWWHHFRLQFVAALIRAGLVPVCGAALPGGPDTAAFSQCRRDGVFTFRSADGSDLHVDHTPPLTTREHTDRAAITNLFRCCLLCQACHSAKTAREQAEPPSRAPAGPVNVESKRVRDTTLAPHARTASERERDPGPWGSGAEGVKG